MKSRSLAAASLVGLTMFCALVVAKTTDQDSPGLQMTEKADGFLKSLTDDQRGRATFAYDDAERVNWHFIPRPRKGLPFKAMSPASRAAAHALVAAGLSQSGYEQAMNVMSLDDVLYLIEKGDFAERRQRRDPLNYYLTVFGSPAKNGTWGWRVEGHHLSLNYTVTDGRVTASTPEFFGANPANIEAGPGRTIRVLAPEEDLARELVRAGSPEQQNAAIIAAKAPNDIPDGGAAQPKPLPPVGLAASQMSKDQKTLLKQLLAEYLRNMPAEVSAQREAAIEAGGLDAIHLAWWGSLNRNERHAYRVQGPSFIIEYNNTQNDANHAHSVWRNVAGDFNLAAGKADGKK